MAVRNPIGTPSTGYAPAVPAPFFLQALLLGFQHTFEPDHLAAVSTLATSRRSMRESLVPVLWRSSHWALGHGLMLMLLSAAALLFKSSLPVQLSGWVEVWLIGPMMIGLGLLALWRGATLSAASSHAHPPTPAKDERFTVVNRSFGVGMLHGAAGTGGALAVALGLAADSVGTAIGILLLESVGVLIAMSGYALLLVYAARTLAKRHTVLLRAVNVIVGVVSIAVGIVWLQRGFA